MLHLVALALAEDPEPPPWDIAAPHGPGRDVSFTVTEGTWLSVDVAPTGDKLVTSLLGDLYELPLSGGTALRLTEGLAWDSDATYSRDGTRILFTSDRGGNENLWSMARDGTDARVLTEEDEHRWTDPVPAPEAGWLLGRKRMTDTRSIGIQELWLLHETGGAGVKLTSFEEHPHAGEAAFSADGRSVWFSTRAGRFNYDDDIHEGLWQIARFDRELSEITTVTSLTGGAVRPTPSPDGRSLALVTRDRAQTVLVLMDVATRSLRRLVSDLDHDQMEGFELRGAYPRMDWTPDGREIVYWAKGRLWRLDVATLQRNEIPFTARIDTRITDAARRDRRLDRGELTAKVIRWPQRAADGTVYAAALGRIWAIGERARALTPEAQSAYYPALSRDQKALAYVSWDDVAGGQVWAGPIGAARQLTQLPGHYASPVYSPDGKSIAFLRGTGAVMAGEDLGAEPAFDLVIAPATGGDGRRLRSIPNRGSNSRGPRLQWSADGQRIYWIEDEFPEPRAHEETVLKSCDLAGRDVRGHVRFDAAQEVRLSPDGRWLAYKHQHQAWVAPMPALGNAEVKAADLPSRKLTDVAGDWIDFAGDDLTWSHADRFYAAPVTGLLQRDAEELPVAAERALSVTASRASGKGTIAFTNARIVTMEAEGVIARGTMVVRDREIVAVGAQVLPPPGATVIDLGGKTILPGLVDVHAHLHYASGDVFPEQEWRHLANLAYGVTTVFDPSASTDLVFGQAELVDTGRMIGPRVLSTGFILYGADDSQGAKIESYEDAERHVLRLLRYGAWGVKSYQQPKRTQRQWIVEACRKLGLLDVPEGGGDPWNNLGMILDGHSSIEHAFPLAPAYADVKEVWARSATTYVPTLLVAYGGPSGEHSFYQSERTWEDARLARYLPPWVTRSRAYRLPLYISDEKEFHHRKVAADAAILARMGGNVALGAHGQLQGLGPHWELEALGGPGAMTPQEALYAGTMGGARHLGLDQDIGSLRAGKIADFFVVDGDPTVDLRAARNVVYTARDGIVYEALTMNQVHPPAPARKAMRWEVAERAANDAQPVQRR